MPGMKLHFLRNCSQRVATGRPMPLKQVEAILLYGTAEQRAKVVDKILPNTYSLCLSKSTHYLLTTMLEVSDNLMRVQMFFQIRRKILDLSQSPVGNVIVQLMLEKLPNQQKKEIAEVFVLNAEHDEFRRLCEHPFGNRVAQKIMEYSVSREVVEERLLPFLEELTTHSFGQHVVAKFVESTEDGWKRLCIALFSEGGGIRALGIEEEDQGADTETDVDADADEMEGDALQEKVGKLLSSANDVAISALFRHYMTPTRLKDAICAHICEYAGDYLNPKENSPGEAAGAGEEDTFALPDFGNAAPRGVDHSGALGVNEALRHHTYITVFEGGDSAHRKGLWDSLLAVPGLVEHLVGSKTLVAIAVAAFKMHPACRKALWKVGGGQKDGGVVEMAQDPARTMLLRAVMEVDGGRITAEQRRMLAESAYALSQNPASSPVLQKMLECYPDDEATWSVAFNAVKGHLTHLITHSSASYFIQCMLQHCRGRLQEELINALLKALGDMRDTLSYPQGSRVMQKILAYADDETVASIADKFISAAHDAQQDDGVRGEGEGPCEDDVEAVGEEEEGVAHGEGVSGAAARDGRRLSRRELREMNRKKHFSIDSHAILSYSLNSHACYVIQTLFRECRSRGLESQRKQLMNELKPFVFELAISPWAGRVVLEAMQQCGSAQLRAAMNNVVFLKAEAWLSGTEERKNKRGSALDPTIRQSLRRGRVEMEKTKKQNQARHSSSTSLSHKKRKIG
ncbi:hypothetical protein TRVL_02366 [Trypanosoma vivax]|uniref:Pumilio/PUF RNA binding protein 7 n=1 Tax=Trypanosoma vivax (strain Y486) TaxID=1055687 RepID=G0U909_TRYVY|nr:hypothetical protein TRVL_02366 [Trypanosoma vivax]CCC54092.1 conserved hypothetical protein [Trypanosoma vivax Y486]